MKKFYPLILLCMLSLFAGAQTDSIPRIIAFHPNAGLQIDAAEKKRYDIFPEYSNDQFGTAELLKENDSTYSVVFTTIHLQKVSRPITKAELNTIYNQIDKVNPFRTPEEKQVEEQANQRRKERERERESERKVENTIQWVDFGVNMFIVTLDVLAWFLQ